MAKLSKRMVETLINPTNPFKGTWQYYRDGRTVRALQMRGLIKSVSHRSKENTWRYKYTASGIKVARQLRLIDKTIREEIF